MTQDLEADARGRRHRGARIVRILLWNSVGAALGTIAFSSVTLGSPWRDLAATFAVGFLFSICISGLCFAVLPRLARWLAARVPAPVYWAGILAAMLVLAAAGSGLALLLMAGTGVVPVAAVAASLTRSLKVSVAITIAVGVAMTLVQTLRGRLEAAELALRTKERDEAEARRIATEAQLASLESRVQPHFLFNTLNSIAALIPADPAGAERMIGQLAALLRSSLDSVDAPLAPLREELRVVRDYLEIERVRFGDRLRFSVAVPPECEGVLVPRMAVQTLVENSVKFAVAPRREGGRIRVAAGIDGELARVEVDDDGPGFDEADVTPNHGLTLVRERLRLAFGDRASLRASRSHGGMRVELAVPR